MDKTMTLKPRLSEKAYGQSITQNVYVFVVPITANKFTVADAVQTQFGVTVTQVRIVVQKGKAVPARRRRARPGVGYRADMKKAYVTLKQGDHIAIFESEEEKATDKKAAKKAKKETK
jgi:large subunit ribosomal protein L23